MSEPKTSKSSVVDSPGPMSVLSIIGVGIATRLLIDTGQQIFFPFSPMIASGLGINTTDLGRLVSLRSATGLFSPLFGAMADRRGYHYVMRLGLLISALGYLGVGLSVPLWSAAIGMGMAGLGTFSFIPTMQAYLSTQLPTNRRTQGLAMVEYAWALSGIAGLFIIGQLIEIAGWRTPFLLISDGLFLAFLYYGRLPPIHQDSVQIPEGQLHPHNLPAWRRLRHFLDLGANRRCSAWGSSAVGGLLVFSANNMFSSYGSWLEAEYQLRPSQLGTVALALGVADLSGSVLVSFVGDKISKQRSVMVGTVLACAGYVFLPILNQGISLALAGLLFSRLAFEFSIVSAIVLINEQAPTQPGKMMAFGTVFTLLGSTTAFVTGPWTYAHYGVFGLSIVSTIAMLAAFITILESVCDGMASDAHEIL